MLAKEELAAIYERQAETVYMVARGYGLQPSDCEDIVHDTFIRLIRYSPDFKGQEHEKAWLIVCAGNLCKNFFRKRSHQDLPLEEWDAPDLPENPDDSLLRCIQSLPERLRFPLHLYYYEGYNSREIADILKLHPASVRRQLSEARKIIRKQWGKTWI